MPLPDTNLISAIPFCQFYFQNGINFTIPVFLWLSTAFWYNKGIENVYHYLTYLLEKFPTSETSDDELEQALGISGVLSEACSWACKKDTANGVHGSQIDLVIVRKDRVIDLCEMKFSGKEYTITAKAEEDSLCDSYDIGHAIWHSSRILCREYSECDNNG